MKSLIRKFFAVLMTLVLGLAIVGCTKTKHTVTFESNGGSAVESVEVVEEQLLESPADPTKEDYIFGGWYLTEDLSGEPYDFGTPVVGPLTLYAKWVLNEETARFVRFVDHRQNTSSIVVADASGKVQKPADPTRPEYRFGGWFSTKRGLTWNDTESFDFNQVVPEGGVSVYAYWEPVDSKNHNWTVGETYLSTLSSTTTYVFNPLTYEYSTEIDIIRSLSTPLYTQEVNWDKAIEDGIADFPGDFSKFGTGEGKFSIDLLKNYYILAGAAAYPKNKDGHDLVDENGNWDPDAAGNFLDDTWVVEIRQDLKFEDGRPITAADYVYTYKQYIDPKQNNKRGSTYFPTEDRKNGYRIVNARSYFLQEREAGFYTGESTEGAVPFEEVGFKAIDDYKIQLTFEVPVGQTTPVGLMNNVFLVHPEVYEASLDEAREKSNYGTDLNPYVSYGAYIIKSWDPNAKIILNKNYDYVLKHTVNFKSYSYQFTADNDQTMELFKRGELSSVGLIGEYASEYAEWPKNYPTYRGYPVSFDLNVTDALDGSRPAHAAIKDINFRKAILFGFERQEFANTLFAPNTASILIWPIEAKQYTGDEFWYKDTPEHKEVLAELGINEETVGFDAAKALQHFNLAWDKWVADGNEGPMIFDFVHNNDPIYIGYANYIAQHFHQLFNVDGVERIRIVPRPLDDTVLFATQDNRAFDMSLDISGWGFADLTFAYMPLKGLYYDFVFGRPDAPSGMNALAAFEGLADAKFYKPVDLRNTLAFLESTKFEPATPDEETPSGFWDATTSDGATLAFYEELVAGEGYYDGTALGMFLHLLNDDFIYWKNEEPFPGAVDDLTRISAGFEYIILDYVTLVPVGSRTSVIAYAENVVILWPSYSYELGWGSARYRYLSTDPDFAE